MWAGGPDREYGFYIFLYLEVLEQKLSTQLFSAATTFYM